jgi:hypothetical protein
MRNYPKSVVRKLGVLVVLKMVANGCDEYGESEFLIEAHPLKNQNNIVPCIITFFCSQQIIFIGTTCARAANLRWWRWTSPT